MGAYVLDQVTKYLATTFLDPAHPVPLLGGLLTLRLIFNPGAAFSLAEDFTVVIASLAILALLFVIFWIAPKVRDKRWAVAIGLLICGIAGNLTDRMFRPPAPFRGHVVDFLQLPYWPIFNVADMCLVFGVVLLVWLTVVKPVPMTGAPEPDKDLQDAQGDA